MHRHTLVEAIERAWRDAQPPRPGHISKPTYDDVGVSAYFAGRTWRGHTAKQLRALDFAPTILTNEAFAYFLAAYMIGDIQSPVEADTIVESLLFNLSEAERGAEVAALLNMEQREAVTSYLQLVLEREGDIYEDDCSEALRYLKAGAGDV